MRNWKRKAGLLVALAGIGTCQSGPASSPSSRAHQPKCAPNDWARFLAGQNARDCTEGGVSSPADQQTCVSESLETGASFYVVNRREDLESYVVAGYVLSATGRLHELMHDSSVYDAQAGDQVFLRTCSDIAATPLPVAGIVFDCVDAGPWICACGACESN